MTNTRNIILYIRTQKNESKNYKKKQRGSPTIKISSYNIICKKKIQKEKKQSKKDSHTNSLTKKPKTKTKKKLNTQKNLIEFR